MKIKRHILRVISTMLAAALVFSGVLFLGSDEYVYAQEDFTATKYTKDYTSADNNFTIPDVEDNTIKYQVTVGTEGESKTYIYVGNGETYTFSGSTERGVEGFCITSGNTFVLKNVKIDSSGLGCQCFSVQPGATLILINVTITGGADGEGEALHGILLEKDENLYNNQSAKLYASNCVIKDCGLSGISAYDYSEFYLKDCTISNCGKNFAGADGSVPGSGGYPGISMVGKSVYGTISGGKVSGNYGHGISNGDNLTGKIDYGSGLLTCSDTKIYSNSFSGLALWFNCRAVLTNCSVYSNKIHGIEANCIGEYETNTGNLINLEVNGGSIYLNKIDGIRTIGKSNAIITGLASITNNGQNGETKGNGVLAGGNSTITMTGGSLLDNSLSGARIEGEGTVNLNGSVRVRYNKGNGITLVDSGELYINGNSDISVNMGSDGVNTAIYIDRSCQSGNENSGATISGEASISGIIRLGNSNDSNDKEYLTVTGGSKSLTIKADNAFEGRDVVKYDNSTDRNLSTLTSADSSNYIIYGNGDYGKLCCGHTAKAVGSGLNVSVSDANGRVDAHLNEASLSKVFIGKTVTFTAGDGTGVIFDGWWEGTTQKTDKTVKSCSLTFNSHMDRAYTAKTVAKQSHTLTFDANGGAFTGEVATHASDPSGCKYVTVEDNENWYSINQTGAYKENQEFLGWTKTKNGTDYVFDMNGKYVGKSTNSSSPWSDSGLWEYSGDYKVFAKYDDPASLTIKFNADGGTPGQADVTVTMGSTNGNNVVTPKKLDSSDRAYAFLGWARTNSSGSFLNSNGNVTTNMDDYDYVYESGAGTGSHGKQGRYWDASGRWCYAGTASTSVIYVRAVYVILDSGSSSTVTVRFDGNGQFVTGSKASVSAAGGNDLTITTNGAGEFVRPGYSFRWWSDIADDKSGIKGNQYCISSSSESATAIAGISQDATVSGMPMNGIYCISGQNAAGLWHAETSYESGLLPVTLDNSYNYNDKYNRFALVYSSSKNAYKFINVATGLAVDYWPGNLSGRLYQYEVNDRDSQYWRISRRNSGGNYYDTIKGTFNDGSTNLTNNAITVSYPSLIGRPDWSSLGQAFYEFSLYYQKPMVTDMTLYAHWSPYSYSVKYDPNGGSGSAWTDSKTFDDTAGYTVSAATYSRTGYVQDGWSKTAGGSKAYDLGDVIYPGNSDSNKRYLTKTNGSIVPSSNGDSITLYAHWVPNETTVTIKGINCTVSGTTTYVMRYNTWDNSTINMSALTITPDTNYKVSDKTIRDAGGNTVFNSDGTCYGGSYWNGSTGWIRTEKNITLYITAELNTASYKVEHYFQNSARNGYDLDSSLTDTGNGIVGTTPTYTVKSKDGFTYNDSKASIPAIASGGSTVVKLYYDRKAYTVTYDYTTNGGTSWNGGTTSQSVYYGSKANLSYTAGKPGWDFVGWNTDKNATTKLDSYTVGTSDVTLYAIYKKDITVTYKDYYNNSVSTNKTDTKTIYNTATYASFTAPSVRNGLTGWTSRGGWSDGTAADASVTYSNGTTVTLSSDTTLYGLYRRTVTLSYNGNGATSTPAAQTGNYAYRSASGNIKGYEFTLAGALTFTGYTFEKWHLGSLSGTAYDAGAKYTTYTDDTMYAGKVDNIAPRITVTPNQTMNPAANDNALRYTDITIKIEESGSGLSPDNRYEYALTASCDTVPSAWKIFSDEYGTTIPDSIIEKAGENLTGYYYLWIKQIHDQSGNISTSADAIITKNGYHIYGIYVFDNAAPSGIVKYIENNMTLGLYNDTITDSPYAVMTVFNAADNLSGLRDISLEICDAADADNLAVFPFIKNGDAYSCIFDLYNCLSHPRSVEKVRIRILATDNVGNVGSLPITAYDFGAMQNGKPIDAGHISYRTVRQNNHGVSPNGIATSSDSEYIYERDAFRVEAYIENISHHSSGTTFMGGHFGQLKIYTFGYVDTISADFGSLRDFIKPDYDTEPNLSLTKIPVLTSQHLYSHIFKIPLYCTSAFFTDTIVYGYKKNCFETRNVEYVVSDKIINHIKTILKYNVR